MWQIEEHALPDNLGAIADEYDDVVGIRDRFLWKWFHCLSPHFRLSTVKESYAEKVQNDKSLLTFYVTLLDDLVDERNDRATFREAAKLPFDHLSVEFDQSGVDGECLELAADVWDELERSLRVAPRFREYDRLFRFDLRQTVNAVRYAYVVNNYPYAANTTEAYAYGSHNMCMLAFADVDLMHSPGFDREEFAALRTSLWTAQRMARIGNWVSTWKRELAEGDFTSGVVAHAYETGIITDEELRQLWANPTQELVDEIQRRVDEHDVRGEFLDQWRQQYAELERAPEMETVDLGALLDGMCTVLQFHLDSEGKK